MPSYNIYATPSGGARGQTGLLDPNLNGPKDWITPPASGDTYWDPVSGTIKSKSGEQSKRNLAMGGGGPATDPNLVKVPYSDRYINPNDPNQRYNPVDIVKSPDIDSARTTLMDTFKKGAADALTGFDDYLGQFKDMLNVARTKSSQATDPSQTIARLRQLENRYDTSLDANGQEYRDLNSDTAARERAIVQESRDLLPSFDTARDRVRDLQTQMLQNQVSRYKAGSGTPRSLGSSEEAQLVNGAGRIAVPLELAKINQRYDILSRYALPVEQDIAGRETNRIASYTPAQLAAQFQAGTFTATTIQQLLQQTSQMAQEDAVRFMQAIGVPEQIRQQILSGQITELGALNQLEDQSRYRGLQDVLGAMPTQTQTYSTGTPGYPAPSRYGGPSTVNIYGDPRAGTPASNASGIARPPVGAPPAGAQGDWVWDGNNSHWRNWKTGDYSNTGPYGTGQGGSPAPADTYDAGGMSRYDPYAASGASWNT